MVRDLRPVRCHVRLSQSIVRSPIGRRHAERLTCTGSTVNPAIGGRRHGSSGKIKSVLVVQVVDRTGAAAPAAGRTGGVGGSRAGDSSGADLTSESRKAGNECWCWCICRSRSTCSTPTHQLDQMRDRSRELTASWSGRRSTSSRTCLIRHDAVGPRPSPQGVVVQGTISAFTTLLEEAGRRSATRSQWCAGHEGNRCSITVAERRRRPQRCGSGRRVHAPG